MLVAVGLPSIGYRGSDPSHKRALIARMKYLPVEFSQKIVPLKLRGNSTGLIPLVTVLASQSQPGRKVILVLNKDQSFSQFQAMRKSIGIRSTRRRSKPI